MGTCRLFYRFCFQNTPKSRFVRGVALRLRQNVGSVSCGPKIQLNGLVPWCKITVAVREFFGINFRKVTVTFSVFNCFGTNTAIICCFTVAGCRGETSCVMFIPLCVVIIIMIITIAAKIITKDLFTKRICRGN